MLYLHALQESAILLILLSDLDLGTALCQIEVVRFHTPKDSISCYGILLFIFISWTLVLAMVRGMSRLDIILLLVRGFVGLLWVGMGGVDSGVSLDISIGVLADTDGLYL